MSQPGCWCCLCCAGVCEHTRVSVCLSVCLEQLCTAALPGHQSRAELCHSSEAHPELGWKQLERPLSLSLSTSPCRAFGAVTVPFSHVPFGSWPGEDFHAQWTGLHQKAFFYIRQWAFPSQSFKKQSKHPHATLTGLSSLWVLFSVNVIATLIRYNKKLKL